MARSSKTHCEDCHQPIAFVVSEATGRLMVLDTSPDPDKGNIARVPYGSRVKARVLGPATAAGARKEGRLLFTAHQGTCPARKPYNPAPPGLFPAKA